MGMKEPTTPKDLDLETNAVTAPPYRQARARGIEADIRADKPKGWGIARGQRNGLLMGSFVLNGLEDPRSIAYARNVLGICMIGSAWHTFAEDAPVMRRRLKLPRLDLMRANRTAPTPDTTMLTGKAATFIQTEVLPHADQMMVAIDFHATEPHDNRHQLLGRRLGHGGLLLASADVGNIVADNPWLTDSDIQTMNRARGLEMVHAVSTTGPEATTLAGFADPDSGIARYVRDTAPDEVYFIYDNALQQFEHAA